MVSESALAIDVIDLSDSASDNALPVFGASDTAGEVTEGEAENGILSSTGTIHFTDADPADTHDVTVRLSSTTTGTPLGSFEADLVTDAAGGQTGAIDWTFQVDETAVEHLRDGETITQTYTLTVSDGGEATWGDEFTVGGTEGFLGQDRHQMTPLDDGGFVVTWTETRGPSYLPDVYARVFDHTGAPVGDDFKVNTTSSFLGSRAPVVTALDDGSFVVIWRSDGDEAGTTSFGISGQVFTAAGSRIGDQFAVNTEIAGDQDFPNVAALDGGGFAVTWTAYETRVDVVDGSEVVGTVSVLKGQIFEVDPEGAIIVAVGQHTDLPDLKIADANYDAVTVTLLSQDGEIGGLIDADSNANGIQVTGTAREVNATLANATFKADGGGPAQIIVTTTDSRGGSTSTVLNLHATNDIDPTVADIDTGSYLVRTGSSTDLPNFKVFDANQDNLTATLTATNGEVEGLDDDDLGVDGIQLKGTAAEINAQLAGATFKAAQDGAASITLKVEDDNGGVATKTQEMTATGVNHGPTITGSDLRLPLAVPVGRAVEISRLEVADANNDRLKVTLTAEFGMIGSLWDVDGIAANGIQLEGTASEINAALAQATFTSTELYGREGEYGFIHMEVDDGRGEVAEGGLKFAGTEVRPVLSGVPVEDVGFAPGVSAKIPRLTVEGDGTLTVSLNPYGGSIGGLTDADEEVFNGIQIVGTAAEINVALANATFTADDEGLGSIEISVADEQFASAVGTIYTSTSSANSDPIMTGEWPATVKVGSEFRVSPTEPAPGESVLEGIESTTITPLEDGGFVQTWRWTESGQEFVGILAQIFDADGNKVGGPVYANKQGGTVFSAMQATPIATVALDDGGYVMAWQNKSGSVGDPIGSDVVARIFNADGTPRTGLIPMTGASEDLVLGTLQLTALEGGGFAFVGSDSSSFTVFGRAFDGDGQPLGPVFSADPANSQETTQSQPRIVGDPSGGFIVVWEARDGENDLDIFARRFDATGGAVGEAFQVNTDEVDVQTGVQIIEREGGVAITWTSWADGSPVLKGRVLNFGAGSNVTKDVTVTITGTNDKPTAANETADAAAIETGVDVISSQEISGTIRDHIGDVDDGEAAHLMVVKGSKLGAELTTLTFGGSGEAAISGDYGTLYVTQDGTYRYVLDNSAERTQALMGGQEGKDQFTYTVANGAGVSHEASAIITIDIQGTNDAPTMIELSGGAVDEGVFGATVGALTAPDPDSANIMFEVLDERFEVIGNQLKLKGGASLDYEVASSVTVHVKATDNHGGSTTQALVIAVRDVADGQTGISLDNAITSVAESRNMASRLKVADITVAGNGATLGLSGTDASEFEIDGNALYLKADTDLNYEAKNTFAVKVVAYDGADISAIVDYQLVLTDLNETPYNLSLSSRQIAEDIAGAVVGTVSVSDPDVNDEISYTVDDGRFEISDGELKLKDGVSLDFETSPFVTVKVTATDTGGQGTSQDFILAVENLDDPPTGVSLKNALSAVAEDIGTSVRKKVADIHVSDDALATNTLSLEGHDAEAFEIVGNSLYLRAGASLDYEAKNSLSVKIVLRDGGDSKASVNYTLALSDVNEAPTGIEIVGGGTVPEKAVAGMVVASLKTIDPDYGDRFTLSLSGPSAALFEVDGSQIKVRHGAVIDYEIAAAHQLQVTASDRMGLTYTKTLTINVRNLPDTDDDAPAPVPPVDQPAVDQPPVEVPPAGVECRGGGGHDRLWGGAGDDRMWGGSGNDRFHAGQGADHMWGGRGNDTFYVDHAGDRVHESRGQGADTVSASVSYSLAGTHVEKLVLTGSADLSGTGNSLANRLSGNAGDNLLKGGAGHDVLKGGAGDDRLHGGAGHDTLTGGSGRDTFVFEKRGGHDTVTDFRHGHDRIDVSKLAGVDGLADLARMQAGHDTLIWHGSDVLVLKGVSAADLDQSDFIF